MRYEIPKGVDVGVPEQQPFIEIEPLVKPTPQDEPAPAPKRPAKAPRKEPVPA